MDGIGSFRRWSVLGVGLLAVVVRLSLLSYLPPPEPYVHDEFSYLLQADTFAHGRLANPSHPYWRFFESIHILSVPTYGSKYQPGAALFLALGQKLFGHPFFGVILEVAFLSAAVCWMLQAWVSPGWALVGGLYTVASFGFGHYWMESYWGGAVAAGGAALVLGAYGRMRRRSRLVSPVTLAAGLVLLWFTRPFEGGFFAIAVAAALTVDLLRGRVDLAEGVRSFSVTLLVCAGIVAAWQGYFDWRVTGSPWTLPYVLHEKQYAYAPPLWILPPKTPMLATNPLIEAQHRWEADTYHEFADAPPRRRLLTLEDAIGAHLFTQFGTALKPLALLGVALWGEGAAGILLAIAAVSAAALFLEVFTYFHYDGALVTTMFALFFRVLWRLRTISWRRHPVGAYLILPYLFILFFVSIVQNTQHALGARSTLLRDANVVSRAHIQDRLIAAGGDHVVFVRYAGTHSVAHEWVYNGADIDHERVIWARDLGETEDRKLIAYYPGRHFWLAEPEAKPARIRPYPGE